MKQPILALVCAVLCVPATAGAVSLSDVTFEVDAYGAATHFSAAPHQDAIYIFRHYIAVDGGGITAIGPAAFDVETPLTELGGGAWRSVVVMPGVVRVEFVGQLSNATDGDGFGAADINVTVTNLGGAQVVVGHYVHGDLDVAGSHTNDTARYLDNVNGALEVTDGGDQYRLTSDAPAQSWMIDNYPAVATLLNSGQAIGGLGNQTSPVGPADVEIAAQYRGQIAAGGSWEHTLTLSSFGGTDCGNPTQLLPDLIVLPEYLNDTYLDTNTQPGRTLLRLATGIANAGVGAVELRGGATTPAGNQIVNQRIFHEDGCFEDIEAGEFEFHPSHGHIHFEGWARYRLRQVTANNGVGPIVASGEKVSFCVLDVTPFNLGLPNAPPNAQYNGCNQFQGISPGWADIYGAGLPDQWIDITGVPMCQYWLEVIADPDGRIREGNENNNVERRLITLGNDCPAPTTCDPTCDDGLFCNGIESCSNGNCQPGTPPCAGLCNEDNDSCVECFNNADCDDGIFCNGPSECHADGTCHTHAPPCPAGTCNEQTDSCAACASDADCTDGIFCNGVEQCVAGACQAGTPPCPGQGCSNQAQQCVECFIDAECNDAQFCNGVETCVAGQCQAGAGPCAAGQQCDDGADICITPPPPPPPGGGDDECATDEDCSDGRFCSGAETCVAGSCVAGSWPCGGDWCLEFFDICAECLFDDECPNQCVDLSCQ